MKNHEIVFNETNWDNGDSMHNLIRKLYPICRSITGNGVRETLSILKEIIPINVVEVPTGTQVLDWEVPEEWNIKDAWIKNPDGEKILDFNELNLHVLNYSAPVDMEVDLDELKNHLYTLPTHENWVPYRTSYYTRNWGFCMTHQQYLSLKEGKYRVKIDSRFSKGSLTYGELLLPGRSDEEVLFVCHICHPSLCNDNLSGIAIANKLACYLKTLDLQYSYRFLFAPATIGAISWLSRNENQLHKIKHGLVLSLLGDKSPFQFKKARKEESEINKIMAYLIENEYNGKTVDFSPYGYDERQFCSPGYNLPVGRLSRNSYGEYSEYHTSADNLEFVKPEGLQESFELLTKLVSIIEGNKIWINQKPKGEPQLGKLGLYKNMGGQSVQKDYQMALLWILNMSDGENSVLDIAKKSGFKMELLIQASEDLFQVGLLKEA